jgi:hypothetical protein
MNEMNGLDKVDTLWGITAYFNPEQYKNKYKNYKKFREASKQQGLQLITVECAFDNTPFELSKKDTDILVQVRCESVLWQKERLLNIALEHLPKECTKVAWVDADILFLNENWISETTKLLDTYKVVQLFDTAVRLKENQEYTMLEDFSYGCENGEKRFSYACGQSKKVKIKEHETSPGFGWAIRRDIIEQVGFYDKLILGGGDSVLKYSFYSGSASHEESKSIILDEDIKKWSHEMANLVNNSVFYVDGVILHLFHGKIKNRLHGNRYKLIKSFNFDPNKDLQKNKDGCWDWSTDKIGLKKTVEKYFYIRNENEKKIITLVDYIKYRMRVDFLRTLNMISPKL